MFLLRQSKIPGKVDAPTERVSVYPSALRSLISSSQKYVKNIEPDSCVISDQEEKTDTKDIEEEMDPTTRLTQTEKILFTDKSELPANDLQTILTAGVSTISEKMTYTREEYMQLTPQELGRLYDLQQKKEEQVLKLFNDALNLYNHSQRTLPSKSIMKQKSNSNVNDTKLPLLRRLPSQKFLSHEVCSLSQEQKNDLSKMEKTDTLNGIILLVDDQFSMVKKLWKHVTDIIYPADLKKPTFTDSPLKAAAKNWHKTGIVTEIINQWGVVYAANGQIAYEVVKESMFVKVMITDQQMPCMEGLALIKSIRALEQETSRSRMSIALHTTEPENNLIITADTDLFVSKSDTSSLNVFIREKLLSNLSSEFQLR